MRKMACSGKNRCSVRFSSRAEARSRPNGFSTTTRASLAQPAFASPSTTVREQAGRDGQVVQRPLGAAERLAQLRKVAGSP